MKKILLLLFTLVCIRSVAQTTLTIDSISPGNASPGDSITLYLHATGTAWPLTPNERVSIDIELTEVLDTPYSSITTSSVIEWRVLIPIYATFSPIVIRVVNEATQFVFDIYFYDLATGIEGIQNIKAIQSIKYYSLLGVETSESDKNVKIEEVLYKDGSIHRRKILIQ